MIGGMKLSVLCISHHTAAVEVREALSLPDERARRLLGRIHVEDVMAEAMVLDTCNRTELYFAADGEQDFAAYLLGHIAAVTDVEPAARAEELYRHDGRDAVEHLFGVTAGLDSQVLGEDQILAQVKAAYRMALGERTAGLLLNKLLHWSFRVGKRVRNETRLGAGAGSIPQAAAAMAQDVLGSLAGRTVLLVGAGETAELAAHSLIAAGADRLIVANRTVEKARAIADTLAGLPNSEGEPITCPALLRRHGRRGPKAAAASKTLSADAAGLDDLPRWIGKADLIITSTGSTEPVLTAGVFGEARREDGAVMIIDIAVPRDVDPAVGELPGVHLYNIDDLNRVVADNLGRRRDEVPRAERIVAEEADRFDRWLTGRQTAPTIRLLRRHLDTLRQREVDRYGKRFAATDREELDRFTQSLLGKLLHQPMRYLRDAADGGDTAESMAAADLIRELFDLDALEGDA